MQGVTDIVFILHIDIVFSNKIQHTSKTSIHQQRWEQINIVSLTECCIWKKHCSVSVVCRHLALSVAAHNPMKDQTCGDSMAEEVSLTQNMWKIKKTWVLSVGTKVYKKNSLQPTFASKGSDVVLKSAARLVLPPDWGACRYWDP